MKSRDVALDSLQTATDARRPAAPRTREGTALCLSGGGYRAALFHLGAFLRLHELGVLPQVRLFSAVSGGSIAAAWLLTRFLGAGRGDDFHGWCAGVDLRREVVEPFRAIAERDLRTLPVLLTLPFNWAFPGPRMRLLERGLRDIFGDRLIRTLPKQPQFVFCATDLTFGVNWVYSRERVGDYLAGYLREPRATLARAVAASSAFPPIFGPLSVPAQARDFRRGSYRGPDADALRGRIQLSDGGVYDNLAMEPALRRHACVLVSDAGAPFAFKAGGSWLPRLRRYTEVVTNQARSLRKRMFFGQRSDGDYDGAYWGLNGPSAPAGGYSRDLVQEVVGRCRTDLDAFSAAEFAILVNHGYWACTDAMRMRFDTDAATAWPYPDFADEARVRRAMRNSHRRFLRWL